MNQNRALSRVSHCLGTRGEPSAHLHYRVGEGDDQIALVIVATQHLAQHVSTRPPAGETNNGCPCVFIRRHRIFSPVGVIRFCGLFLGVPTLGQFKARAMSNQAQVDALEHLLSIIKSSEVSIAAYETFENAQAITDG